MSLNWEMNHCRANLMSGPVLLVYLCLRAPVVRFAILPFVSFKRPKRLCEDENTLYDYAVRALGRRMRTVAELKRLMRQRVPKDERGHLLMEMVILRLKDQKYLNDTNYAAAYASFRRDNEKFGKRRVITDLKVKGVHADVIEKAVEEAGQRKRSCADFSWADAGRLRRERCH